MERVEADELTEKNQRGAFAVAALLHVLLLLAAYVFWNHRPPPPGVVQSVAIKLTGPSERLGPEFSRRERSASDPSRLETLQRRLEGSGPLAEARPAATANDLAGLIEGGAGETAGGNLGPAGRNNIDDPYGRVSFDKAAASMRAAQDRIALQVSRCLAQAGRADPVSLDIRLRRDGSLARPAQIVSPDGVPAPARTVAQVQAIQVVTRCAPYASALGDSADLIYRIDVAGAPY